MKSKALLQTLPTLLSFTHPHSLSSNYLVRTPQSTYITYTEMRGVLQRRNWDFRRFHWSLRFASHPWLPNIWGWYVPDHSYTRWITWQGNAGVGYYEKQCSLHPNAFSRHGIRASMALTDLVVVFHIHLLSLIINCTKVKLICQVGKSTYLFSSEFLVVLCSNDLPIVHSHCAC